MFAVDFDLVRLRLVLEKAADADADVCRQSAHAGRRERVGDPRVEADAHRADERDAVDGRGVDHLYAMTPADRVRHIHWKSEVAGEPVA